MLNKNKNIRSNIALKTRTSSIGSLPLPGEGKDGDVRIFNTKEGPGLYGKIRNQWLRFGDGEEVGYRGRRSKKKKVGLAKKIARTLDISSQINIGKSKLFVTDVDELSIGSAKFNLVTYGTNSYVEVGDLTFNPLWGNNTIKIPSGSNNSSKPLKIQGGDSTGGSSAGGNLYIKAGSSAGGNNGSIYLGHNGTSVVNPYTTNIYGRTITLDATGDIIFDAGGADIEFHDDGTKVAAIENLTNSGTFSLYSLADNNDYFWISTGNGGITTISTTENAGTDAHLNFDIDGDINFDADNGHITFKDNGTSGFSIDIPDSTLTVPADFKFILGDAGDYIYGDGTNIHFSKDDGDVYSFYDNHMRAEIPFLIKEQADAIADVAGYGQLWVDTATPNELAFTDDAGTDIIGIGKYHYETKFIAYNAGATGIYFPMNGYVIEGTTTSGRNEYQAFLAPHNGTIQKIGVRTEIAQDGDYSLRVLESADGTEIPGTMIFRNETTVDIADDIYQELDMTGPGVGSDYCPLTKGRIYMIYLSHPSIPFDTNVIMVFKWDITS